MNTILTYDGSFEGLLTCAFEVFDHKLFDSKIQKQQTPVLNLFDPVKNVISDKEKAARVWKGLAKKASKITQHNVLCLYLSELADMEQIFIGYVKYLFNSKENVEKDFGNLYVLEVAQIERKLHREKHRMEAFIRFSLTKDQIYFATIEPDFNVLPLIMPHFKNRYADQQWIIYDLKRGYGLYYNKEKVVDINYHFNQSPVNNTSWFDDKEALYQQLWKDYFKSTNITARKNLRLHVQHVPKRYWKYLVEKQ